MDKPPTLAELVEFRKQAGLGPCSKCGGNNGYSGAEPVHPYYRNGRWDYEFLCCSCHNGLLAEMRAERKAYLASLPRCEFCNRRGTNHVGAPYAGIKRVLLCGHHVKRAQAEVNKSVGNAFWLAWDIDGDSIRAVLREALGR